jgi:hypothetical protein
MDRFSCFHPTLAEMLRKLADPKYSIRDVWSDRFAWVRAGCPIFNDAKRS